MILIKLVLDRFGPILDLLNSNEGFRAIHFETRAQLAVINHKCPVIWSSSTLCNCCVLFHEQSIYYKCLKNERNIKIVCFTKHVLPISFFSGERFCLGTIQKIGKKKNDVAFQPQNDEKCQIQAKSPNPCSTVENEKKNRF